ncbi:hypothetical protein [Paenibacillus xylanexedens]|uniref:hypothetical protein n=1 Tax=Paenibacillus xylanexedens TaxID=528191 RepID=UPI00119D2A63|nr:hypothetical protein [Paenibacillus xylanexedens]
MPTVPSMVSQQLGLLSTGADPTDVRDGQSFIKPGSLAIQAGTMPDNGDLGTIVPGTEKIDIPLGYTSGGFVQGDENLVATNIKAGVDLFGVTGTAVLAEGNAMPEQVLDGVTYSTGTGADVGSMPNNGDLGTITPGTSDQLIPLGYTTGGTVAGDTDLIASNIRNGTQVFGVTGTLIQATGTTTADKLLAGETASNTSGAITGTMPNNGALGTITPTTTNQSIPLGYTSGGTVAGSANLLAGNIRLGVNMFGVTGTLDPGAQTGGSAVAADVLSGKTFTNDTGVQTGSMVNRGAVSITPSGSAQTIQQGYHNGSGTVAAVTFDATKVLTGTTIAGTAGTMVNNGSLGTITPGTTNQTIAAGYTTGGTVAGDADLIASNIKNGVNIFGVTGTLSSGTPFATGTTTTGSTASGSYYPLEVTGLGFKPNIIVYRRNDPNFQYSSSAYSEMVTLSNGNKYVTVVSSGTNPSANVVVGQGLNVGSWFVYESGFKMPTSYNDASFAWAAFQI